MRKALIVGIDYYENVAKLNGCINDAYSVRNVLERNSDGTINFGVNIMVGASVETRIYKRDLKQQIEDLFRDDNSVALFYFAGHGYIESTGGYLVTSECEHGDEGFSLNELLSIVNSSPAKNKIIVLDCCHAGIMGVLPLEGNISLLSDGVSILTASSSTQYALSSNDNGVFTSLFVDALNGGAANLLGDITPGSVYAHIDQSLGPWEQRPIFKTNVKSFTSLRKVQPTIGLDDLRKIIELFDEPGQEFCLDPSFEPDSESPNEDNMNKFSILQKYNRVNLVIPVGEEHMYYAAMNSKSCKLTALGVHYWNLVKRERI
ncbi:hypothetical protein D781_0103 [Serratia sp. FGI94]|uniref:caspase family protein n=1 Tax=Serratia sp. FGI94 TaxID=671990 RepID=UPI0002A72409|nr:caspase family protein [Serratia sp. FGI94]AGB80498.1 hypothetical protein D781_0103 [Serratia sp. FGI94]